jgi:hypothetical protein
VPCNCALRSLLDPEWEGFACACIGAPTWPAPDGGRAVLALVQRPGIEGPPIAESALAELVLHGRERLSLPEWLEAIKREAEKVRR